MYTKWNGGQHLQLGKAYVLSSCFPPTHWAITRCGERIYCLFILHLYSNNCCLSYRRDRWPDRPEGQIWLKGHKQDLACLKTQILHASYQISKSSGNLIVQASIILSLRFSFKNVNSNIIMNRYGTCTAIETMEIQSKI